MTSMFRRIGHGTIAMILFFSPAAVRGQSIDLTGLWVDDTGGGATYRVRQIGNQFFWAIDGTSKGSFANALMGTINGNAINAEWVDVPGSPSLGAGRITFRIESKDRFVKVSSSAPYGAQVWTRLGAGTTAGAPRVTDTGAKPSQIPRWEYEIASQSGWKGTWTRRGQTDIYDVVIQDIVGTRLVYVERIIFDGNKVRTQRLESADRIGCNGEGTLQPDGVTYLGVSQCSSGPSGWNWLIRPAR